MNTYANKIMSDERESILADHPNMAKHYNLAALGNRMIIAAAYYLCPPRRRASFLESAGYYGEELDAELARRNKLEADYEGR